MILIIANILVEFVALLHVYFLVLEVFLWDKPLGLRTFGHSRESATASKTLAMNQALSNGFLAAGLVWGLSLGEAGNVERVDVEGAEKVLDGIPGLSAYRLAVTNGQLPQSLGTLM